MKNPSYQEVRASDACSGPIENNNSPADNDELDVSYEKVEAEAKEVWFLLFKVKLLRYSTVVFENVDCL